MLASTALQVDHLVALDPRRDAIRHLLRKPTIFMDKHTP